MGRFYFHLKEGSELVLDDEGQELPSASEATTVALASARELLAEAIRFGLSDIAEAIVIADETGQPVLEVPLVEVLPPTLKSKILPK
jgi:hypothetical protein